MASHEGGLLALAQQCLGRHHQLDLDRHPVRAGLPGDTLHEDVGHEVAAATRVAVTSGNPGGRWEGGMDRDALGHWQQRGQVGHGVRRRTQADPPLGLGPRPATRHGLGVELAGHRARPLRDLGVTQDREVVGQPLIDLATVHDVEHRGLPAHDRGPPLADPTGREVGHGAGHLARQRPGQPEVSRPASR